MRFQRHRSFFLASTLLLASPAFAQDAVTNVEVRSVTLATGGIAEVEGGVSSPTDTMRLAIERPQVADVLKTLVVTGEGSVVSIGLEAAEPVGERSVTGRLLGGNLSAAETLLRSLIGEDVQLVGGPNRASGRLLAFERVTIPGDKDAAERSGLRVSLASPEGRVSYTTFPSLDALSIEGEAVAERVKALLPALDESVDDGRRELVVRMSAESEPGFRFVVPTTVWRPSYRALVKDDGSVGLQGWATLENTTGLDWNAVDLRLAVGTPVAYAQDVYSPLRTRRPNAPFAVGRTAQTNIVPGQAAEMMAEADGAAVERAARAPAFAQAKRRRSAPAANLATGGPAQVSSATTIFPVAGKIDLDAGRTLSVPFFSAEEKTGRVAYLDLVQGARQPLDALELTFDADATVPGGLVAVYDADGFAGDARFAGSDGGETRILPFAISAALDATVTEENSQSATEASFRNGALLVTREATRNLTIALKASRATEFVLDLPRIAQETITAGATGGVKASTARSGRSRERIRADLPAGATELTIRATRPIASRYLVTNLALPIIEEVLAVGGDIDPATRARLQEIAKSQSRIATLTRREATLSRNVQDLRQALQSDRANLEAIGPTTPEGARIRQRIIERTEAVDQALQELRTIRDERLKLQTDLAAR